MSAAPAPEHIHTFVASEMARMFGPSQAPVTPDASAEIAGLVARTLTRIASLDQLATALSPQLQETFVLDAFVAGVDSAASPWPGSDEETRVLATALAQSFIYSAGCLTGDEWGGSPREGVSVCSTHVLAAARCNAWLSTWAAVGDAPEDTVPLGPLNPTPKQDNTAEKPDDAAAAPDDDVDDLEPTMAKAAELRKRLDALELALPEPVVGGMKVYLTGRAHGLTPDPSALAPPDYFESKGTAPATLREIAALEQTLGFALSPDLRAWYLARDGVSLAQLDIVPLFMLLNTFMAHDIHMSYMRDIHAVPVRNPVAGGRWGEALDVALCDPGDNNVVIQAEHFFPPTPFSSSHAYALEETLALVEAAAAASRYTDRAYWNVKIGEDRVKSKLADFDLSPTRLARIEAGITNSSASDDDEDYL